eukprot:m.206704 g.206704  ORF g.206704 m.206704 type:complete len:442 (+) comp15434_c0_seq1:137-1462(+)
MAGRVKGDAFAAAVPKVINTMANMTSLSGSLLRPPVIDAMSVVSAKFVDMHALYDAAGDRIAALCRAPAGYTAHVVCGAAAGLAHATAASLTKDDHAKIRLLPDTSSFERRVVLLDAAGDPRWDAAIKIMGATLRRVGVDDREALRRECARQDVACFIWFDGYNTSPAAPSVAELCEIAHSARGKHDPVPVIVDAASRLPPVSNLWSLTRAGADCVIFSGGKAIRGPQTSGFLLGRRDMIMNARANGSPNEAAACRPMKTSKETVVGIVAALEAFVQSEVASASTGGYAVHDAAPVIASLVDGLSNPPLPQSITLEVLSEGPWPDVQPRSHPHLAIRFGFTESELAPTARDMLAAHRQKRAANEDLYGDANDHGRPLAILPNSPVNLIAHLLAVGSPAIAVNTTADGIVLNPYTMTRDDAITTARRLREVLAETLQPASKL